MLSVLIFKSSGQLCCPKSSRVKNKSLTSCFLDLNGSQVGLSNISHIDNAHANFRHSWESTFHNFLGHYTRGKISGHEGRALDVARVDYDKLKTGICLLIIPGSLLCDGFRFVIGRASCEL